MSHDIPERDWKKLRALKDSALNIACERIFQNITKLIESRGAESHKYFYVGTLCQALFSKFYILTSAHLQMLLLATG
ncbi:MAG: hypothetical protein JRF56_21940 [Deltaproteobacteria bacterium]|jgi:hypothetical protein|nr:hypothetical protein [Deltaproteobacteria bacterium]